MSQLRASSDLVEIDINQVTVKYVGRKDPAFTDVSLSVRSGETVLLLGASGSGKSTLALTLNGLIPHSLGTTLTGQVCVDGLDTQLATVADLARKVGIVFQDPEAQFVTLKVEDEIVFGLENLRHPPETMSAKVDQALSAVRMSDARQRPIAQLSGGEKQRIALAALLAMEPGVLVFDEPTANLDPVGTRDVFDLIAEHKRQHKHTIILIEHKLDALMHLIDRVVVLGQGGAVIVDGPPAEVFGRQADTLLAEGVWMPQVCSLAHQLRKHGLPVTGDPLTLDQAAASFQQLNPGSNGRASHGDMEARAPDGFAPAAVEVRELHCDRGGRRALDNISLTIGTGEFVAVVGANGAGKTTLAQHVLGLLPAPPGRVLIEGQDITRIPARELIERVGFVFQNPEHQFVTDSVFAEVAYGLRVKGLTPAEVEAQTTAMLERFGLLRLARANPFTLSHGQKRRLSVASMLAVGQRVLILDEPTFGQDQRNADALMGLLGDLHREGRTVVIITHDMALVAEYAQRVAVLHAGRLIFHGPTRSLFAQPDVLAQARLTLPPIADLATRVPALQGVLTMRAAIRRLTYNTMHAEAGSEAA